MCLRLPRFALGLFICALATAASAVEVSFIMKSERPTFEGEPRSERFTRNST